MNREAFYGIAGTYQQPHRETPFKNGFYGFLKYNCENNQIVGQMVDSAGKAAIDGIMTSDLFRFNKYYIARESNFVGVEPDPVEYILQKEVALPMQTRWVGNYEVKKDNLSSEGLVHCVTTLVDQNGDNVSLDKLYVARRDLPIARKPDIFEPSI